MPLLQTLQRLADVLVRIVRVLIATISRSVVGIRWLTRTALRVRVQGSNGVTGVARLYDLHAVVVAADLSLLAGLVWAAHAPAAPQVWAALLGGVALALPLVPVIGRAPAAGRAVIGLSLVGRGVATLLAAQWLTGTGLLLLALVALILPQWAVHLTLLRRMTPPGNRVLPTLGHAVQYALFAGLVTGVTGLVIGAFVNGWPMWVAAVLLSVGALLALRLPAPVTATAPSGSGGHGAAAPPPTQRQPRQDQPTLPEGFHVYRPSSLEPGDEGSKK